LRCDEAAVLDAISVATSSCAGQEALVLSVSPAQLDVNGFVILGRAHERRRRICEEGDLGAQQARPLAHEVSVTVRTCNSLQVFVAGFCFIALGPSMLAVAALGGTGAVSILLLAVALDVRWVHGLELARAFLEAP